MASEGLGLGKEVLHGLFGGVVLIVIGVAIGSVVAQVTSHGPEVDQVPASEAAPASTGDPEEVKAQEPDPAKVNERLQ